MESKMSPFRKLLACERYQRRYVLASIPLPIFNRNQGEIARTRYAITQAQEQQIATNGQALTDVKDAYEGLQSNDKVVQLYISQISRRGHAVARHQRIRIQAGVPRLLNFLDAERSYRATELAYRQALASYLLALEQLRQAVGTRALP
jgi:outer membrane protein, heavy metal efflux system